MLAWLHIKLQALYPSIGNYCTVTCACALIILWYQKLTTGDTHTEQLILLTTEWYIYLQFIKYSVLQAILTMSLGSFCTLPYDNTVYVFLTKAFRDELPARQP